MHHCHSPRVIKNNILKNIVYKFKALIYNIIY